MRDVIDEWAAITPGSRLDGLRALRPDVRAATQAYEDAIFDGDSGLSFGERHAVAMHVAEMNGEAVIVAHHRAHSGQSARLPALIAHAEMLTMRPDQATPEAIQALLAAGLSSRDVVMLSQLIAHVNYQTRLLAGLRLLEQTA